MSTVTAHCRGCGKAFRVPDPARTYPCKACGGEVAVDEAAAAATVATATATACPACGADAEEGASFCAACGVALDGSSSPEANDVEGRRAAVRTLARAKKTVGFARSLYRAFAVIQALFALLLVAALFHAEGEARAALAVTLVVMLGLVALHWLAAAKLLTHPMPWSLAVASLKTLDVAWQLLVALSTGVWIGFGVALLLCLALWWIVSSLARAQHAIRRYPALWDMTLGRAAKAKRAARAQRGGVLAWIGRRLLVLGVAIALIAAVVAFQTLTHAPPPFEPALTRFVEAWNGQRRDQVLESFPSDMRPRIAEWLNRRNSNRDWTDELPELTQPVVSGEGDQRRVEFQTWDGTFSLRFRLTDGEWQAAVPRLD